MAAGTSIPSRRRSSGPLHRVGLPGHPGSAGVSRMRRSMPATSPRTPLPSPQRNVRDYGLEERIRCCAPTCSPPMPASATTSSSPIRPTSAPRRMAAFPPEYAAEPRIAHAGGVDGLDVVRRILAEAGDHLSPDGHRWWSRSAPAAPSWSRNSRSCRSCGSIPPRARARYSCCPRVSLATEARPAAHAPVLLDCAAAATWRHQLLEEHKTAMATGNPFTDTKRRPHIEAAVPRRRGAARQPQLRHPAGGPAPRRDAGRACTICSIISTCPTCRTSDWQVEIDRPRRRGRMSLSLDDIKRAAGAHAARDPGMRRQRPRGS